MIIDIDRGGRLLRQFAAGPRGGQADQLARVARGVDPDQESVPAQVHSTGKSVLLAHLDDPARARTGPDGTPLLMMLGATSLICVPISDGTTGYGTLTADAAGGQGAVRRSPTSASPRSSARHLAIAIRVDRVFRQRSQVAEALQASLLPARLPAVPGLEFAAAYIGATQFQEISGDFYDVFKAGDGWGIAVGDVCGKGQDAAAMTAAARHAIRALAHVHDTPADVLAAANEVLVAEDYDDRFVTASLAFLRQRGRPRAGAARLVRASGARPSSGPTGGWRSWKGTGCRSGCSVTRSPASWSWSCDQGDVLFFYTDGVTEARSADLSFFEDRLADALAAVAGTLGRGDRARRPGARHLVLLGRAQGRRHDPRGPGRLTQTRARVSAAVTAARRGPRSPRCRGPPGAAAVRLAVSRLLDQVVFLVEQGRPGGRPALDRGRARVRATYGGTGTCSTRPPG